MEGVLLKWTNYFSGWQPRWFVLSNDILSYYKSQEEMVNGCKGSIRMATCDIRVHQTDHCRLDLIIPGEQHFYVRAATSQERQQWLVALGSAKASQKNARKPDDTVVNRGDVSPDLLRTKKSELRLYCDLLMQQVHSVKSTIQEKQDIQKLEEASSLLGPTCDTFIQTLEECMALAKAGVGMESGILSSPIHSTKSLPSLPLHIPKKKIKPGLHRTVSHDSTSPRARAGSDSPSTKDHNSSRQRTTSESSLTNHSIAEIDISGDKSNSINVSLNSSHNNSVSVDQKDHSLQHDNIPEKISSIDRLKQDTNLNNVESMSSSSVNSEEDFKDAIDAKIPTFFSTMDTSFMDLHLDTDGSIPVEEFLLAAKSILPLFDKFNATAFAPVKMDFQGNIRKIHQKYSTNTAGFTTLQKIVLSELNKKQHLLSNSATMALLWMKRGLEFIREFLYEIIRGEPDLSQAVTSAYSKTLRNFHGWVVRGVFAVAAKALPYRDVFISNLSVPGEEDTGTLYQQSLMSDIEQYITAMDVVIKILNDFYKLHDLNSDDTV
ncbi:pleckstrin homology domain-containing family A member 8-like [Mytilus californianus]|uniref:pleckstrin homology domain-containing family A member 8-like n=1 Tax=Mytilus californianus TaxID=6549 RepID=UPI0022486086|nr:pleckstrin homology domain-containing family A member 8-like [Mytilus californianus]